MPAEIDLRPLVANIVPRVRSYVTDLMSVARGATHPKEVEKIASKGMKLKSELAPLLSHPLVESNWPGLAIPHGTSRKKAVARISVDSIENLRAPVFITGEPGAGKTTLLRRLTQRIARGETHRLPVFLPLIRVDGTGEKSIVDACWKELKHLGYQWRHWNVSVSPQRWAFSFFTRWP